ncbi:MAG: anthranilate synthase component I [Armatimonadota bacterium]|nr:anthranilate synthase component I [Armatimonadota bacterium]MDR7548323.1 anthranilate synthase component I [Armatimonadota bacterium]
MSRLPITPTKTEFLSRARSGNLIPVTCDLFADLETPISAFLKLRTSGEAYLLESVEGGEKVGRYSFIGADPAMRLRAYGRQVDVWRPRGAFATEADPLEVARGLLAGYRPVPHPGLPRFYGGAVGYFGYDCVRLWERLPNRPRDPLGLPTCYLIITDAVVIFDHVAHTMRIVANATVDGNAAEAYRSAVETVERIYERLRSPLVPPEPGGRVEPVMDQETPAADFLRAVERAREYVYAGDIFQVVLSRRFSARTAGVDALDVYRALRTVNPSPYMFFLDFEGVKIVGSSPELLVRLEDGVVETRPLAGTRPRGLHEADDRRLEAELLADEKERAEHTMLVDLGRNDLGRVCRYGTVEVTDLMSVERFSHVMHIVSNVRGVLNGGRDAFDVLRVCFPAGTVTGAPKVRAMEIIDALEPVARGPYAGAVGYVGYSGNMDTAITIRSIVMTNDRAYVQAGAGIVADSIPEREYLETVSKAKALVRALEIVGRSREPLLKAGGAR